MFWELFVLPLAFTQTDRQTPPPLKAVLFILPPLRKALALYLRAFAILLCTLHDRVTVFKGIGKDNFMACETAFH